MTTRIIDPSMLCWALLEIVKTKIPRSNLSPESRRIVAQACKWMRGVPARSELRASASFALANLQMTIPPDDKSQHLVRTMRLALNWLPDGEEPTDQDIDDLAEELLDWSPESIRVFTREVLQRWSR